jgi:hypothetical protein
VRSFRFAVALIILYASCARLHGQGQEVIVHELPLHVRHFAGTVVDSKGMTVEYSTVELRDPRDHRLLATTFADGKGSFYFDDKKYGKRVEIWAFQKGFNIVQYMVIRRPFGDMHIRLVLSVAT